MRARWTHRSLLLLLSLIWGRPAEAAEPTSPRAFSLSISGGVSLGAYEAGATAAFIRYLRSSDQSDQLVGVTGASAGAINALMAVEAWCSADLDDGVLRTWLDVGIEGLLPARKDYADDDRLFQAAALDTNVIRLTSALVAPRHRRPCRIPLAFTLTLLRPREVKSGELTVGHQLVTVFLVAETAADGSLRFVNNDQALSSDTARAHALFLPEYPSAKGGQVKIYDLLRAVRASAAFPMAFAPVQVEHCGLPDASHPPSDACNRAPLGRVAVHKALFMDGGVFDNIGLGSAILQAEATPPGEPRPKVTYIHFDPDVRRKYKPRDGTDWDDRYRYEAGAPGSTGRMVLDTERSHSKRDDEILRILSTLANSARQASLFDVLASSFGTDAAARPAPIVADRFWPLAADQLRAFAAFLDRSFREHDYLVGEYEATWQIVRLTRDSASTDDKNRFERQIHTTVPATHLPMLRQLFDAEQGHVHSEPDSVEDLETIPINPPTAVPEGVDPDVWRVHWALTARGKRSPSPRTLPFGVFLGILRDTGFRFREARAAEMLDDSWQESFGLAVFDRMADIETDNTLARTGKLAKAVLSINAGRASQHDSWAWSLLPSSLTFHLDEAGVALNHDFFGRRVAPGVIVDPLGTRLKAGLSLSALSIVRREEPRDGVSWIWAPRAGVEGALAGPVATFGVEIWGALLRPTSDGRSLEVGGGGLLGLLGDSLRLSLGVRAPSFAELDFSRQRTYWMTLAFRNLVPLLRAL